MKNNKEYKKKSRDSYTFRQKYFRKVHSKFRYKEGLLEYL